MDNSGRNLVVALIVLLLIALSLSSTMGGMMGPGMFGRWGGWTWGFGMWLGGLAMLIFWGALIIGALVVVRLLGGGVSGRDGSPSPLDILKRRYASGEITREQYEQMRKDLEP